MKEEYHKKGFAPNYLLRWINTAGMAFGLGILIAGGITKNQDLQLSGLLAGLVSVSTLNYELGINKGEKHFYRKGSISNEKSNLTKRIRDFYLPPKKEKILKYNVLTGESRIEDSE